MSNKFRILNLPFVPIHKILSHCGIVDLIDFSLCSTKCKNAVQTMPTAHNLIELSIYSDFLQVYLKRDETALFEWAIGEYAGSRQFRKINRWKINVRKSWPDLILSKCRKNIINISYCKIAEFLIDLFPRCLINLTIRADNIANLRALLPRINRYQDVRIHKYTEPVSNEYLRYLLENVVITGDILLSCRVSPDFQCPSVRFHCNKWEMYVNSAHWITREMLLSSHCSEIMLYKAINLKPTDFLEFVENWKRSTDKKLKYAIFRAIGDKFPIEPLDLEHLEPKKWDPEVRGQSYPHSPKFAVDLSMGIDISRSDGLIATIRRTFRSLEFYIWHDRFPNIDGLQVLSDN